MRNELFGKLCELAVDPWRQVKVDHASDSAHGERKTKGHGQFLALEPARRDLIL